MKSKKIVHKRYYKYMGITPFGLGFHSQECGIDMCGIDMTPKIKFSLNWDYVTCKACLVNGGMYTPPTCKKSLEKYFKGYDYSEVIQILRHAAKTERVLREALEYYYTDEVCAWTHELDNYVADEFPEEFDTNA